VLAGICALLVIAIEILSQSVTLYSGTYRRVTRQYAEAVGSRPSAPGSPVAVLMVGNSLLLDGVEVDRLQQLTSRSVKIYPIFLEGTEYYDWLYGLRRLFRRGARPQVVIVGLGIHDVLENALRQEFVPRMLLDARDILDASSDLGLNATATSGLLLAHWSSFWDMRHAIRLKIFRRLVPGFEDVYFQDLWSNLRAKRLSPVGPESEAIAISRLRRLRQLAAGYGATVVILIPPTPSLPSTVRQMTIVAQKAGVDTLVPVDPSTVPARYYQRDDIHLNQAGAELFTTALAAALPMKIRGREPAALARLELTSSTFCTVEDASCPGEVCLAGGATPEVREIE
jgi:hypothetical protein